MQSRSRRAMMQHTFTTVSVRLTRTRYESEEPVEEVVLILRIVRARTVSPCHKQVYGYAEHR